MRRPLPDASANLRLANSLYDALRTGDVTTLRDLLTEDFEGDLSPGLPDGLGVGTHVGRDTMLRDGWGRIATRVDLAPVVDDLVALPTTIIARGRYVGLVRSSRAPVEARFAHFWEVRDGRFSSVHQVTDSAMWHAALDSPIHRLRT